MRVSHHSLKAVDRGYIIQLIRTGLLSGADRN
jgi:hypothetical protein